MKSETLILSIDALAVESFVIDAPEPFGVAMYAATTAPCVKETLQTMKTCVGGETCGGATCGVFACA